MRNTKNSIRNLIISVFLLAAVVITGCGGSVTPEPTEAPATSEPTQAPDGSPVGGHDGFADGKAQTDAPPGVRAGSLVV